jgi:RNA polymerase sigma factor (sigma-70 family)
MNVITNISLLTSLKNGGSTAEWEVFYALYAEPIFGLARRAGLIESDAQDVVQETMMAITRALVKFEYDPQRGKFRNWVLRIATNKTHDAYRRQQRQRAHLIDVGTTPISELNPATIHTGAADAALESAWRHELIRKALSLLELNSGIKPKTLAIFRAVAIDDQSPATVAREHGVTQGLVNQIRSRITAKIKQLVTDLEAGKIHAVQSSFHPDSYEDETRA